MNAVGRKSQMRLIMLSAAALGCLGAALLYIPVVGVEGAKYLCPICASGIDARHMVIVTIVNALLFFGSAGLIYLIFGVSRIALRRIKECAWRRT